MDNAHKVHGVCFSSNGHHDYEAFHREKEFTSETDALTLARKMAAGDAGSFGNNDRRPVNPNTNLLFDVKGAPTSAYIAIFLFRMKDKFLLGEPVSSLPTLVVGEMKSFFTVVDCSEKHVLLKIDMVEVMRQKQRLEASDHEQKHTLEALPICLNIVHDPFGSSLSIIGHKDSKTSDKKSIGNILTHGGFHPPVAYVQV